VKSYLVDCVYQKKKDPHLFGNENVQHVCDNPNMLPHVTFFEPESDDKSKPWPKDSIYGGLVEPAHLARNAEKLLTEDYVHEI
jgi:hypothetical protein